MWQLFESTLAFWRSFWRAVCPQWDTWKTWKQLSLFPNNKTASQPTFCQKQDRQVDIIWQNQHEYMLMTRAVLYYQSYWHLQCMITEKAGENRNVSSQLCSHTAPTCDHALHKACEPAEWQPVTPSFSVLLSLYSYILTHTVSSYRWIDHIVVLIHILVCFCY